MTDDAIDCLPHQVTWQMIGQQVIVQPRNPCDLQLAVERAPTTALRHEWAATLANLTTADYATRTVRPWDPIEMSPGCVSECVPNGL